MKRIRTLLIGKHADIIVNRPSVEIEIEEDDIDEEEDKVLIVSKFATNEFDTPEEEEYLSETDIHKLRKWDSTYQGLTYILGVVARKFRVSHPELATKTSDIPFYEETGVFTWVSHLSRGGLLMVSQDFLSDGEKFEIEFQVMHGPDDIDRRPNVIRRFARKLLLKFGTKYPKKLYDYFATVRTKIRNSYISGVAQSKLQVARTTRYYKQIAQHSI